MNLLKWQKKVFDLVMSGERKIIFLPRHMGKATLRKAISDAKI